MWESNLVHWLLELCKGESVNLLNETNKDGEDSCEQFNTLRLQKILNHFYKEEQVTLTTYKILKDWMFLGKKKKIILPGDVFKF